MIPKAVGLKYTILGFIQRVVKKGSLFYKETKRHPYASNHNVFLLCVHKKTKTFLINRMCKQKNFFFFNGLKCIDVALKQPSVPFLFFFLTKTT